MGKQKYNCSLCIHKFQEWIIDRLDIWSIFYYTYCSMAGLFGISYPVKSLLLTIYIFDKYDRTQAFLDISYTISSIHCKTILKRKISMYLTLVGKIGQQGMLNIFRFSCHNGINLNIGHKSYSRENRTAHLDKASISKLSCSGINLP